MSVRASASVPSNCSGAMYWKVPRIDPSAVSGVRAVPLSAFMVSDESDTGPSTPIRARPKSSSFTPLRVSITFPGFRSLCTTPLRCAAARASAISRPYRSTSSSGNGPPVSFWARVVPSRYSMTR